MNFPKMILFDYGHTLIYEPTHDWLSGQKEVFKYIRSNQRGVTAEEVNEYSIALYEEIMAAKRNGFEVREEDFRRYLYESLGIELSISYEEAERMVWESACPGVAMPGTAEMLAYLAENGVRTGVISNLGNSREYLSDRINRLLPDNRFEFIIASSEYVFRKPSRHIFDLALSKAGLDGGDVWYCGDNPLADVEGAAGAGIFPVWYDSDIDCTYRDKTKETAPSCEYLKIKNWSEMTAVLERLKSNGGDE